MVSYETYQEYTPLQITWFLSCMSLSIAQNIIFSFLSKHFVDTPTEDNPQEKASDVHICS
jgi:hypothetical protein